MPSSPNETCRLCGAPVPADELRRRLCSICDDYAQHVALHSNKGLERIVGELQNRPVFREPSRRGH
jgi:hypothetical protein